MRFLSSPLIMALLGTSLLLTGCSGSGFLGLDDGPDNSRPPPVPTKGVYKVGKPYKIAGQWYYPAENFDYDEVGIASWYGPGFHGRQTASGERYDMHAMTAAHRTLPMPSLVKVTNLQNGRTAKLLINDRGPFHGNRILDVSKKASEILGFQSQGTTKVRVQILPRESLAMKREAQTGKQIIPPLAQDRPEPATAQRPFKYNTPSFRPPTMRQQPIARIDQRYMPEQANAQTVPVQDNQSQPWSQPTHQPSSGDFVVQAGAFRDQIRARRISRRLSQLSDVTLSPVWVQGEKLYRVRLGPVKGQNRAELVRSRLVENGYAEAHIIQQ